MPAGQLGNAPVVQRELNKREEVLPDGRIVTVADIDPIIAFDEELEIWERQPSETDRAWAAFEIYRSLDPLERSDRRVLEIVRDDDTFTWVHGSVHKWKTTYRWEERVRAFDQYVAKIELAAVIRERVRARKETANLGRSLRLKAQEALKALSATLYRTVKNPETGEITRELRSSLTASEISRLADTGAKLERLALDMEHADAVDGTPKEDGLDRLTINYFAGGAAAEKRAMQEARAILEAQAAQAQTAGQLGLGTGGVPREASDVVDGEFE